jgi:hypothetical protein
MIIIITLSYETSECMKHPKETQNFYFILKRLIKHDSKIRLMVKSRTSLMARTHHDKLDDTYTYNDMFKYGLMLTVVLSTSLTS